MSAFDEGDSLHDVAHMLAGQDCQGDLEGDGWDAGRFPAARRAVGCDPLARRLLAAVPPREVPDGRPAQVEQQLRQRRLDARTLLMEGIRRHEVDDTRLNGPVEARKAVAGLRRLRCREGGGEQARGRQPDISRSPEGDGHAAPDRPDAGRRSGGSCEARSWHDACVGRRRPGPRDAWKWPWAESPAALHAQRRASLASRRRACRSCWGREV
mmetsp:Transcript_97720/g.276437  ORF Transcript_97720/g.276437 Transcript_97720/m.276437 type:complete len:212 (-) Transcript_97720:530-1165(-)